MRDSESNPCACGHDAGSHYTTNGHCGATAGAGPRSVTGVCHCPKYVPAPVSEALCGKSSTSNEGADLPHVPAALPEWARRALLVTRQNVVRYEQQGTTPGRDEHLIALLADRLDARERENTELKERLELSEFACRHNGDYMNELEAARVSATARAEQAERDRTTLAAILNVVDVPAHNAAVLTSGVDMLEYMRAMERGVASSSRGSADHA